MGYRVEIDSDHLQELLDFCPAVKDMSGVQRAAFLAVAASIHFGQEMGEQGLVEPAEAHYDKKKGLYFFFVSSPSGNMVQKIKVIRNITGWTLKEAKDWHDEGFAVPVPKLKLEYFHTLCKENALDLQPAHIQSITHYPELPFSYALQPGAA